MECADIRDALARGETPKGPELDAHVSTCEGCAELLADDGTLGLGLGSVRAAKPRQDLSALLDDTIGQIARETGPIAWLRSRPTPARIALALAAVALVGGGVLAFKRRPDFDVYPLSRLVAAVGAYALVIGVAVRVALRPLHARLLPMAFRMGVVAAAILIPFAIAAAPAAHGAHLASLAGAGSDLVPRAAQCFLFGSALALPALALLWALDRGGHRALPTALASAGAAGLMGIVALELHCPITHPIHLMAGHAAVCATLVLAYAVVTARRRAVV